MTHLNPIPDGEQRDSAESAQVQIESARHARIRHSFKTWVLGGKRAGSLQVPFGAWWEMEGMLWRVSWIEKTGELYATELAADRFIVLGRFRTKREVAHKMQGWFGGDNLDGLIHQLLQINLKKKD